MKNEETTPILKGISTYFSGDLAIANYEMIQPNDPFGQVMLENLEVTIQMSILL
jgi:hypothetical protein